MAELISDLLTLGVCWLALFAAFMLVYVTVMTVLWLIIAWQSHTAKRRSRRAALDQELAEIDRRANGAVHHIGAAFLVAQRLIREEAALGRGDYR